MSNILKQTAYRKLEGAFRIQSHYRGGSDRGNEQADVRIAPAAIAHEVETEKIIRNAKRRADELLQEAVREAERLQAEAKAAIESWWNEQRKQDDRYKENIRKAAYDEGYMQGYESGIDEAKQQMDEQLNKAREIVEASYIAKEQVISEAEPFLVRLSLDIAEKVITRQIALDHSVIVDMIQKALEHCHETGIITVLVKPDHFPLVQEARDELKQHLNNIGELKILPDRTIESDGCIIRSQRGSIDARIDVQLSEIRKVLTEVAKEGAQPRDVANCEIPEAIEAT